MSKEYKDKEDAVHGVNEFEKKVSALCKEYDISFVGYGVVNQPQESDKDCDCKNCKEKDEESAMKIDVGFQFEVIKNEPRILLWFNKELDEFRQRFLESSAESTMEHLNAFLNKFVGKCTD